MTMVRNHSPFKFNDWTSNQFQKSFENIIYATSEVGMLNTSADAQKIIQQLSKYYGEGFELELTLSLKNMSVFGKFLEEAGTKFKLNKISVKGDLMGDYYTCKGEKAIVLHFDSNTDELRVFMATKYSISFHELHIVDYKNDTFLMLSNFEGFEWENLVVTNKILESWREYLSTFSTSMIVVLKKSIRSLSCNYQNKFFSMKNIQKWNLKYTAFSIDCREIYTDIEDLGPNNEISITSRYWDNFASHAYKFWEKLSNSLRHVYISKSNLSLLEHMKTRKFYIKTMIIDKSWLGKLTIFLDKDMKGGEQEWKDTQAPMIDHIIVVIENKFEQDVSQEMIMKLSNDFPFSMITTRVFDPWDRFWLKFD